MNFEVITDPELQAQIQSDLRAATQILSMQVLIDCNYYCKQDQGGLISSSITASDLDHGELIWDTVYAVMQYYLDATCKDVNNHATKMWCEKAFSVHGPEWEQMLQKILDMDDNEKSKYKSKLQSSLDAMKGGW